MTDKIKGGGFGIRALSGYDAEDARFEVDVDYMRELPKHPGHPMDPAKVKPGLVCKCWATNADIKNVLIVRIIRTQKVEHAEDIARTIWA